MVAKWHAALTPSLSSTVGENMNPMASSKANKTVFPDPISSWARLPEIKETKLLKFQMFKAMIRTHPFESRQCLNKIEAFDARH